MKVTLNKANKLRNDVEKVSFDLGTSSIQLRTDIEDPLSACNAQSAVFKSNLENYRNSLSVGFHLRTLIAIQNGAHGITDVIGQIAYVEKQIKEFQGIVNQMNTMRRPGITMFFEDFIAQKSYTEELVKVDPKAATPPRRVQVMIVDDAQINEIKEEIKALKLKVQQLQEQRNALNHQHFVELPGDVVEFLKSNSLV